MLKQVNREHYSFHRYFSDKCRWASIWHQLNEVLAFNPKTVLEVGPGIGLFKATVALFGPIIETLDIDPELEPDHLASVFDMPFENCAYDVVCAFQMLEHLPYEQALHAFKEMIRVAKCGVVISIPDARPAWPFAIHIPYMGTVSFLFSRPTLRLKRHKFDGEHYWEINKKEFPIRKIMRDFSKAGSIELDRSYRVNEYPFHRFFIFRK